MNTSTLIPVDCCVNDEHGSTTNRLQGLHFPGLDLEPIDVAGVHFRVVPGGFYLSRRKMIARHLASCVGNIFWERYGMEPYAAAFSLHYARQTGLFQPDAGHDELWRWWKSNIVDHELVKRLLVAAAKDDRL